MTPRLSASSYSNTAPLVWSFLYGSMRGTAEVIMDNAPARSAELLAQDRVDAALVPVIAYQLLEETRIVPEVCVGAQTKVGSVCLVTDGRELRDVGSVALDTSSRTSVALTKIVFREFLGFEPVWHESEPEIGSMLSQCDAALLIGDPALRISNATGETSNSTLRTFDLAEIWHANTGLGFVFAMWMTKRRSVPFDLAAARDEGIANLPTIAANYATSTGLAQERMLGYLSGSISYSVDEKMHAGMDLYFSLALKHGLITQLRPLEFVTG